MSNLHAAVDLAAADWPVFMLSGKVPLIPRWQGGRGHLDGTTDVDQVERWWSAHPSANIGARVPDTLAVLDVDPRSGGLEGLAELERIAGAPLATLTSYSGREDGGRHLFWLHPGGKLRATRLPAGVDLKAGGRGYVVLPPSIHPATGRPYRWAEPLLPPAPLPVSLVVLLRPPAPAVPPRRHLTVGAGGRPGDRFNESVTWQQVLSPHAWVLVQEHGAVGLWRKPRSSDDGHHATTNARGTDRLHVFSAAAPPFDADESYSKFAAWAMLNHAGDFVAAARALREAS